MKKYRYGNGTVEGVEDVGRKGAVALVEVFAIVGVENVRGKSAVALV